MDTRYSAFYGEFEWDSEKNRLNKIKHGMSFEKATAVFQDERVINIFDSKSSLLKEDRFKAIGMIEGILIVAVIHTEKRDRIRVISARRATKLEIRLYYERNRLGKTY